MNEKKGRQNGGVFWKSSIQNSIPYVIIYYSKSISILDSIYIACIAVIFSQVFAVASVALIHCTTVKQSFQIWKCLDLFMIIFANFWTHTWKIYVLFLTWLLWQVSDAKL